jgi:RNA polymerase sigma-70 factor, ECF subfamily
VGSVSEERAAEFSDFFHDEYGRLGRALYLMTGDRAEAEDIAQEALVRVYERWDRVGRMDSPTGYLYRTAMNLARSRLRRLRGAPRDPIQASSHDPMTRVEARTDVMAMLATLPGQQRRALVLIDWLEFDADEAARILRVKNSTMRVHLSRGRKSLRALMDTSDD